MPLHNRGEAQAIDRPNDGCVEDLAGETKSSVPSGTMELIVADFLTGETQSRKAHVGHDRFSHRPR